MQALSWAFPQPDVNLTYQLGNTALFHHAGRLLAMMEGGYPFEIRYDAKTNRVASEGVYQFGGQLQRAMAAHPKVDPHTGEMLTFSLKYGAHAAGLTKLSRAFPTWFCFMKFRACMTVIQCSNVEWRLPLCHRKLCRRYTSTGSNDPLCVFNSVSASGRLSQDVPVPLSRPQMMHDFAFTEHYIIFLEGALVFDAKRMVTEPRMGTPFTTDATTPCAVLLMAREAPHSVQRIEVEPFAFFHTFNAWEDGAVGSAEHCVHIAYCRCAAIQTQV
jgi:9-cis-epoxycarotenoid dioxygenase